jgi:3-oxoacyl-[acyl-carrier protein] reductase
MTAASYAPDRVAVVTGGSRGIGRRIAETLASQGFNVVVNYAANDAAAEETVAAIEKTGARGLSHKADVADDSAIAAMFERVDDEFGGIDVVVHAAGIMALSSLIDLDLSDLDRLLRTNLRGTFVVDQQAVRRLRPGGSLINIASSLSRFARPGYSAYTASKGGMEAITLTLAHEMMGHDVTVNAVAPGPIPTDLFLEDKTQKVIDGMTAEIPLGRLGTPDDVAQIVAFLAGPGRWINGQVIYANGGAI